MQESGIRNGAFGADKFGLKNLKRVHWNLGAPQLYQHALAAGEAVLSADGALCADTGDFTGRSPKDKFTVRDATTDKSMWWTGNQSITSEQFDALYTDFLKHAEGMTLFAQDLYGGADPSFRIKTRVFTELAWHSLFIRTLLIRPEQSALADFVPELTVIDLPISMAFLFLQFSAFVGLASHDLSDDDREWWARAGASPGLIRLPKGRVDGSRARGQVVAARPRLRHRGGRP